MSARCRPPPPRRCDSRSSAIGSVRCRRASPVALVFVPGPPEVGDLNFVSRVFGRGPFGVPLEADRAILVRVECSGGS